MGPCLIARRGDEGSDYLCSRVKLVRPNEDSALADTLALYMERKLHPFP